MKHDAEPPEGLRGAAKAAVEACGYDFGAVDLLVKDGDFWFLEVNKAPGLSEYTANAYASAICRAATATP
jgi:D-alanine-D-alanine ligase-like ATP-grasp enzyme